MALNSRNNVLVVGGSSGVGLAVAKLALSHLPGANIIISSSTEEKLKAASAELTSAAPATHEGVIDYIQADVSNFHTQFADVEALLKSAVDKFGAKLDHIVWTAGKRPQAPANANSNDDLLDMGTTRSFGPLTLISLAPSYMAMRRQSSITFTSGVLVYRPMKGRGRTAASGNLEAAARGMAVDLAPVRCNVVVLGAIQTPLWEGLTAQSPGLVEGMKERTLVKTIGTAEEAAEAYLFCARCAYVTGSRVDVEGGFLLC